MHIIRCCKQFDTYLYNNIYITDMWIDDVTSKKEITGEVIHVTTIRLKETHNTCLKRASL